MTLGLTEPFTQTLTVAGYFAVLFALPIILFQAYAFLLPAFSPRDRRSALPLLAMVPVLFVMGVAFAYVLVLPAAVGFLQGFNQGQFDALVQARPYYGFTITTMAVMGLLFQIPVGVLALTRLGADHPRPAAQEPALRDRRDRDRRRAPAGRRSRHDADRDGADGAPLRAEHPARRVGDAPGAGRGVAPRRLDVCSRQRPRANGEERG